MYTCGIDVGSVSTEALILDEKAIMGEGQEPRILSYTIVPTGSNSKLAAEKALEAACKKANIDRNEISFIVATGYGRVSIPFADKNITEITCHAKGVTSIFPDTRTVIDVGGQDSKVIKLDQERNPVDFLMNDKCAAGTGRFLEVMAKALEIRLEEFQEIFMKTKERVEITSTCTVFAESEIVSLIGHGVKKEKIVKGLIYSVANRIASMVERLGLEEPVCMTGGVAKNLGVIKALEENLKVEIKIPPEPQITGALGAAYLAQQLV
ncbi:MAG: 2-hydroxyglutaryl-CoA dehydratase [Actinobacteria bacterium]|nr:2-hydroxyglutaryl-CoA dehydratase [Actinomycetota bacterium]